MREKDAILYIPYQTATWKLFYSLFYHWLFLGFVFVLLFTIFHKSNDHLIIYYHHLSTDMRAYLTTVGGFTRQRWSFNSAFLSLFVRWNRHISQSNFQNNSLMFSPVQGTQAYICLALTLGSGLIGDKMHREIELFYVMGIAGRKACMSIALCLITGKPWPAFPDPVFANFVCVRYVSLKL